jgi:ribosomal protein S18 acetylase RimI-like enzyme
VTEVEVRPEPEVRFRLAKIDDLPVLLELFPLYYADDHLVYDAAKAEAAIRAFLADPALGRLWFIEDAGGIAGYLALTFGFSFEFGGREAFVDELYVRPEKRGLGYGSAAIRHAISECRRDDIVAIRLEVTKANAGAYALYARLGFEDHGRSLLAYPL